MAVRLLLGRLPARPAARVGRRRGARLSRRRHQTGSSARAAARSTPRVHPPLARGDERLKAVGTPRSGAGGRVHGDVGAAAVRLLNGRYDTGLDHVPVVVIVGQTDHSARGGSQSAGSTACRSAQCAANPSSCASARSAARREATATANAPGASRPVTSIEPVMSSMRSNLGDTTDSSGPTTHPTSGLPTEKLRRVPALRIPWRRPAVARCRTGRAGAIRGSTTAGRWGLRTRGLESVVQHGRVGDADDRALW
jgi:hypothetical protein